MKTKQKKNNNNNRFLYKTLPPPSVLASHGLGVQSEWKWYEKIITPTRLRIDFLWWFIYFMCLSEWVYMILDCICDNKKLWTSIKHIIFSASSFWLNRFCWLLNNKWWILLILQMENLFLYVIIMSLVLNL